jgi:hypothetical protein
MTETTKDAGESRETRQEVTGESERPGSKSCMRYRLLAGASAPDALPVLEQCTSTLESARTAQAKLGDLVEESDKEVPTSLSQHERTFLGHEQPVFQESLISEKYNEFGGDDGKLYRYLVGAGKELKRTDMKAFYNFLRALDVMLYANYGKSINTINEGKLGRDIFARIANPGVMGNEGMKCGQISKILLNTLKDMGIRDAYAGGAAGSDPVSGSSGGHYVTLVKLDDKTYGLLGAAENHMFTAANIKEAFKIATRLSPGLMSSGVLQIHGQEDGKYYSRYALDEEAALAEDTDYNSDKNLSDMKLDFADLDYLTSAQKKGIAEQMKVAKDNGLKIRSLTLRTEASVTQKNVAQDVEVVFTGVNEKGEPRILVFDANVAMDRQKMSLLWKTYSQTTVDQFSLQVKAKETGNTGGTTMYDYSNSIGVMAEGSRTWKLSPADAFRFGAKLTIEGTAGNTFGGQLTDRFLTGEFGSDFSYIRTLGPLDVWIGPGIDVLGVGSDMEGEVPDAEGNNNKYSGGTFVMGGRLKETAGVRSKGNVGPLHYDAALAFSLVHEMGEDRPDTQNIVFTTGTQLQGRLGVFYKVNDNLGFSGRLYGTQLNMPYYDRQVGGYRVGVTLRVGDMDITADAGQDTSKEVLKIGPKAETTEDSTSTSFGLDTRYSIGNVAVEAGLGVTDYKEGPVDVRARKGMTVSF